MKFYTGLAEKKILFRVVVEAKSKSEAIKKIRNGIGISATPVNANIGGYMIAGGSKITMNEIDIKVKGK